MATEMKEETRQTRSGRIPWGFVVVGIAVLAAVIGVLIWSLRPQPLQTAEGYLAGDRPSVQLYTDDGTKGETLIRGTAVTYVVESESKDHPGMVRLVTDEDEYAWVKAGNITDDPKAVVTTQKLYVRTAMNLTDKKGVVPGALVQRGQEVTILGWEDLDKDGQVGRYHVRAGKNEGYINAGYLCRTEKAAKAPYDEKVQQLHTQRGDSWGGGDAKDLDYYPRQKAHFKKNVMPHEVKALYLNNEFVAHVDTYLDIAAKSGINAFVIDIQDGGAIAYASPTMKKYSPSAYGGVQYAGGVPDGGAENQGCRILCHRPHHHFQ